MSVEVMRELRQWKVCVLHPADREIDELMRHLKRIGCQTELAWPPPTTLASDIDVVFFAIAPEGPPVTLPRLSEPAPALVAIVEHESPSALKSLLDSDAHSFITKPIRPSGVLSSLLIARSLHGYHSRLLAKVAKLEETLRSRREIERATRILMDLKALDEDSAYQLIRTQATAQRLSMGAVARSVITAHRVFDSSSSAAAGTARGNGPDTRPVAPSRARNVLKLPRR